MTRLFEAKPFLIAEVGSNWQTLDQCIESIGVAKKCGADAVKFQAFDYQALYGLLPWSEFKNEKHTEEGWSAEMAMFDVEGRLDLDWLPALKAEADRVGIEFMCTAFSPELLAAVDPFVEVHKIASSDAAWPQMLEAVKASGKPAIFSTGGKTGEEADRIEDFMDDGTKYISTYCVAAYPADYADLRAMAIQKGYSDHTLGYTAAVVAAREGAIVIEKHFTAFPDLDTPDRPHSLTPKQFKRMVDIIRGREVESEETAMFLRHNRRLIATRDIIAGAVLKYGENYGAYRSLEDDTRGASPFDWEKVEGRMAKGPIARGKGIGLGDVE